MSRRPPRFSFKVWPRDIAWSELQDIWIAADQGDAYDGAWLFDHFYPPRPGQRGALFEAWTLLAALGAVTSRLRLGVMVSSNTFRHPSLLAKMAVTVDQVSNGRLDIGLGAGWHAEEHEAFGIDLPPASERWQRLDETCAIVDGLLTQDVFSFEGTHHRLEAAEAGLKPVQQPRPPLVIGGVGPKRTLPLVAKWADHWNYFEKPMTPESFGSSRARLVELCGEVGRDPGEIEISVQMLYPDDPEAAREMAATYLAADADHILMSFRTPVVPGAVEECGEALASLR
ncbi:MAG: TIGR03560 family F420-dependent LLM class oxidoreductase [Acidimicrobiia bacterium]|nr:TIGR03560 family F420-dependent LLM class oxidoreductase [Acidimicrobiia bacterium]